MYPPAALPSRVVRMGEVDKHDFISSSCTSGKKGTGTVSGREPQPMLRNQLSHCKGLGLGGVHACSPILAAAWKSTDVNSGWTQMIVNPPMLLSTSDPLSARWMEHWACLMSRVTRTAAAGGVKGMWGLARRNCLKMQTEKESNSAPALGVLCTQGECRGMSFKALEHRIFLFYKIMSKYPS